MCIVFWLVEVMIGHHLLSLLTMMILIVLSKSGWLKTGEAELTVLPETLQHSHLLNLLHLLRGK